MYLLDCTNIKKNKLNLAFYAAENLFVYLIAGYAADLNRKLASKLQW